jgi:L-seryl-tRNA(Ser) seleniumtransferase
MLASLAALAGGREVIVARGQVGDVGDLRLTDAATQAAARLIEVGAAHQVSIDDYRLAITTQTSAIVRLVPADYALVGRISSADLPSLVSLAANTRTPVIECLEAATLIDFARLGSTLTTVVGQSIVAGADLVIFSGQRCLGGPNCGIVVGSRALVERIAAHPLYKALEADRLAVCALEATLRLYRDPAVAEQSIPLFQLLACSVDNLRHRAARLCPQIERCAAVGKIDAVASAAYLGSGRLPGERISSWSILIEPVGMDAATLAANLRAAVPSLWTDVEEGRVALNLRGVLARQDEQVVAAFQSLGLKPSTKSDEPATGTANPAAREDT